MKEREIENSKILGIEKLTLVSKWIKDTMRFQRRVKDLKIPSNIYIRDPLSVKQLSVLTFMG